MVRSYAKALWFKKIPSDKHSYSEIMDLKIAEAITRIQEEGGTIINSSLLPSGTSYTVFLFYVLYEDNGNFEVIDNLLRNVIFNFDKL